MLLQHLGAPAHATRKSKAPFRVGAATTRRAPHLLAALALTLAGCNADSPLQANSHSSHPGSLDLASLSRATAQSLDDLRRLTASFHDLNAAQAAGYNLFVGVPLTAPDGCISSMKDGGMGYHYSRLDNLTDDSVTLLDPEFLVYAPTNAPRKDGEARRRLAAFDYFIPYSPKWPGPDQPNFKRAPTLHDFPTMSDLPDIAFAPSRFSGWMFHIWLWEHNPDGMFANWNSAVPLCQGSAF